jgi:hypothetical protein
MFIYFYTLLLLRHINLNNAEQVRVLGLPGEKPSRLRIIDQVRSAVLATNNSS